VTLVGFSRGHSLNVYAGRERLGRPRNVSHEESYARL
jgi:FdhD protein